jgi:hypothetical protein
MRLIIREQNPACLTFDQRQQQALNHDFAHVVPVPGKAGQWLFYGRGKQLINIDYSGPSLFLYNVERRRLTQSNNPAAPNQTVQRSFRLPASGVYYLETDPFATSLESSPPAISAHEPPELALDNPVLANAADRFWEFTGRSGLLVQLELHTDAAVGWPRLFLYDEQGSLLTANNNDSGESHIRLDAFLAEDGVYRAEIDWWGTADPYTITLTLIEPQMITLGSEIEADPSQRWWQFEANRGNFISIAMDSVGHDPYLRLFNASGEQVAFDDDGGVGRNALIHFPILEEGLYKIDAGWFGSSIPGPYTLTLTLIDPQMITLGSEIEADPSQRWWQFEGRAEEIVEIGVEAFEPLETEFMSYPSLRIYDAAGVLIDWDDNWLGEPNALVQVLLPESGLYTIQANWDTEPTRYQLTLNSVEIVEPVDSGIVNEAEMIQYGQTRQGSPEQQRWQFEANPGDFITIAMDSPDHDPYLRLFDANGVQVAFDDDGGGGLNALIQFLILENGFYEIDAGWFGSSSPSPYTLTLDRVETISLQIGQSITANTRERIWQFNGQEEQIVSIHPEAIEGAIPYFTVLDAQGNNLLTNYYDVDQDLFWYAWLPVDGIYYIVTNWYDTPGLYQLTLKELNPVDYPQIVTVVTSEYISYLFRRGFIDEGLASYEDNHHIFSSTSGEPYNEICWFGSLWGYAADVMFACQTAVFLEPNNTDYIRSRGVARAMIGDFEGAIADLRYYAETNPYDADLVRDWIDELEADNNPFNETLLKELLPEELRR